MPVFPFFTSIVSLSCGRSVSSAFFFGEKGLRKTIKRRIEANITLNFREEKGSVNSSVLKIALFLLFLDVR